MTNTLEHGEQLSALADGQLPQEMASQTLDWLLCDDAAQSRWNTYHLLGEVIRTGVSSCPEREFAFMQRFNAALAKEPSPIKHDDATKIIASEAYFKKPGGQISIAANDAWFHQRLAVGFVALLAVALVSWSGLNVGLVSGAPPQLVQVIVPTGQSLAALPLVVAGDAAAPMMRDPQLDAFLAAHKQFGGTSAFQKPSGFLSTAVFEGAPR